MLCAVYFDTGTIHKTDALMIMMDVEEQQGGCGTMNVQILCRAMLRSRIPHPHHFYRLFHQYYWCP